MAHGDIRMPTAANHMLYVVRRHTWNWNSEFFKKIMSRRRWYAINDIRGLYLVCVNVMHGGTVVV